MLELHDDGSFLELAKGKAIKVTYPLVLDLPQCYSYRVLIIECNIEEVLDSQARMLAKQGMTSVLALASHTSEKSSQLLEHAERVWSILESRVNCEVL